MRWAQRGMRRAPRRRYNGVSWRLRLLGERREDLLQAILASDRSEVVLEQPVVEVPRLILVGQLEVDVVGAEERGALLGHELVLVGALRDVPHHDRRVIHLVPTADVGLPE